MRKPIKPPALALGGTVRIISPASPVKPAKLARGLRELKRLGYRVRQTSPRSKPPDYFAAAETTRRRELETALRARSAEALLCARGGYGTSPVLDGLKLAKRLSPKLLIGYSDITALQSLLWQRLRWVTLYGPMVAAGFDEGAGKPDGYDLASFTHATTGDRDKWTIPLQGESLVRGDATGVLLGGCITLIENTLGTPWELDTRGAILILEDCTMKPYQVDRMLVHLAQAGKFRGVRGLVLGDFPKCEPPKGSRVTVRDICRRILAPLGIPLVFGAPIGHSARPMLTVPLGVRARLHAAGAGKLEILESAVRRKSS
jgi:muramoyltetrapeptide carboxypeptidase